MRRNDKRGKCHILVLFVLSTEFFSDILKENLKFFFKSSVFGRLFFKKKKTVENTQKLLYYYVNKAER